MYRAEIIANQSVQDDITEALEAAIPGVRYTILPLAHGRGGANRKLGSTTWPETNFVLFAYVADADVPTVKRIIAAIKNRFADEGITLFLIRAED
ncbi:MAG: hypothetical protein HDR38_03305 [Treponema sp.]|nr:hypothetical protein [Treponema sp.]